MPLNILLVPDKFKGTLTAKQAVAAIAGGWREIRPHDRLDLLPMADGGDGFGSVLGPLLSAEKRFCPTVDAAGRPRRAEWWYAAETATAVIEAAEVNGLRLLPEGRYHPFELDTFGLGAVLRQAEKAGARRLYLGLGGSATNDGGFGMARALGWRFWAADEKEILSWSELEGLTRVEAPPVPFCLAELLIAVDVVNPLLGQNGASRIYGPQKGLRESDLARAEAFLARLAEVMLEFCGEDHAVCPGAGAAGGLGFGLRVFCGGCFRSGGEIFAEAAQLEERIQQADLVITAEGALDQQTLMGKGVGLIAAAASRAGKPCLCLVGSVSLGPANTCWPGFKTAAIVPEIATLPAALVHPVRCLRQLAAREAGNISQP